MDFVVVLVNTVITTLLYDLIVIVLTFVGGARLLGVGVVEYAPFIVAAVPVPGAVFVTTSIVLPVIGVGGGYEVSWPTWVFTILHERGHTRIQRRLAAILAALAVNALFAGHGVPWGALASLPLFFAANTILSRTLFSGAHEEAEADAYALRKLGWGSREYVYAISDVALTSVAAGSETKKIYDIIGDTEATLEYSVNKDRIILVAEKIGVDPHKLYNDVLDIVLLSSPPPQTPKVPDVKLVFKPLGYGKRIEWYVG